jgi:hypothetical protein
MDKKAQYEALIASSSKPVPQPALERKVTRAMETLNATDKDALYKLLFPDGQNSAKTRANPSK